eukprot:9187264-Prorocentrum_lima.AAC.1
MEAPEIPETDWSHYNKEQVLNQLETLARKKLVPYAKTRFNIIPAPTQEVKTPRSAPDRDPLSGLSVGKYL